MEISEELPTTTTKQPGASSKITAVKLDIFVEKCKDEFLEELARFVADLWLRYESEWYLAVIHLDTFLEDALDWIAEDSKAQASLYQTVGLQVWHIDDARPDDLVKECFFRIETRGNWRIELIEMAGNIIAKENVHKHSMIPPYKIVEWSTVKGCLIFRDPMECILMDQTQAIFRANI